jgi:hypothetical protein
MAMAKSKQIEMVKVAIFDDKRIYQGITEIPVSELTEAHVALPRGCDRPACKYFWEPSVKAFLPLYTKGNKQ